MSDELNVLTSVISQLSISYRRNIKKNVTDTCTMSVELPIYIVCQNRYIRAILVVFLHNLTAIMSYIIMLRHFSYSTRMLKIMKSSKQWVSANEPICIEIMLFIHTLLVKWPDRIRNERVMCKRDNNPQKVQENLQKPAMDP